jgi:hypothetical protein
MELLQLDVLNLSGVGHFYLTGKNFHLCMWCVDPAHQIFLTSHAVLSHGDLRVSFPAVLPVMSTKELWKKGAWCVSSALCQVAVIDKCAGMTQSELPSSHWVLPSCHQGRVPLHFFLGGDEGSKDGNNESDDNVGSCLAK